MGREQSIDRQHPSRSSLRSLRVSRPPKLLLDIALCVIATALSLAAVSVRAHTQTTHPVGIGGDSILVVPVRVDVAASEMPERRAARFVDAHLIPTSFTADPDSSPDASAGDTLTSRRGGHLLLGMALGTAGGAALGYLYGTIRCHAKPNTICAVDERVGALSGAFLGLVVGGLIGAYAEKSFPAVGQRHVSFGAVPYGRHSMALTLQVRGL